MSRPSLLDLPLEVVNSILTFLDVASLLQISRTSHLLRTLSLDPLLQKARLERVRHDLNILLTYRQPKSSISPPNAWIWLSRTNVLSRSISKSLIKIRLNHSLERRPSIDHLVEKAIVPEYCSRIFTGVVSPAIIVVQEEVRKSRLKDTLGRLLEHRPSIDRIVELNIMPVECAAGSNVSPRLVETRRKVIKENLKDGLRAWLKSRAIQEQKRKEEEYDSTATVSVKAVVRRFTARRTAEELGDGLERISSEKRCAQHRWGRGLEVQKRKEERKAALFGAYSQPTRAHVQGLRGFWEGVIKATSG